MSAPEGKTDVPREPRHFRFWDNLHERFEVKRINHQEAYSLDGACTNWAEEYFSRLRRAEIGVHHHVAGAYLLRYAQESSWREDNRSV
jgi:ISXO2-like transposase domain